MGFFVCVHASPKLLNGFTLTLAFDVVFTRLYRRSLISVLIGPAHPISVLSMKLKSDFIECLK
jgi:hypothetical protein